MQAPESYVSREWDKVKHFLVELRELTSSSLEIETSSQFFYLNIDGKNVLVTPQLEEIRTALVWIRAGLLMARDEKQLPLPGLVDPEWPRA